jgi:hypothetical protein
VTVDLTVALVTLLGTLIVLTWNIIDRSRSSFEDRMSIATDFLTGGTQKRSAGIAIISSSRARLSGHREVAWRTAIVLLLCTQAIYLLEQSGEGDRPDELLNLRRIIELLITFDSRPSGKDESAVLVMRIKDDLRGVSELSRGLNRAQVERMITGSPAISKWLGSSQP